MKIINFYQLFFAFVTLVLLSCKTSKSFIVNNNLHHTFFDETHIAYKYKICTVAAGANVVFKADTLNKSEKLLLNADVREKGNQFYFFDHCEYKKMSEGFTLNFTNTSIDGSDTIKVKFTRNKFSASFSENEINYKLLNKSSNIILDNFPSFNTSDSLRGIISLRLENSRSKGIVYNFTGPFIVAIGNEQ